MHPLLRTFLAIVIGCLSAFAVVAILELAGHAMFPVTARIDMSTPATMEAPVQIPLPALLSALVAWLVGTFAGGLVAALIAPSRPRVYAALVGAVMLLGTVANMATIPHPGWFSAAAVIGIAAAAWAGGALIARRRQIGSPLSRG